MDLQFGDYRLMRRERQLVGPNGVIDLSARSFDILQVLLQRPEELISKDELFAAVWPGMAVEENTLQVHVSALRKALDPNFIVTVHGRGYKYAGPTPVPAAGEMGASKPDSKPVIAVLPFDNLSGDPDQQYFSDGITADIIDRLTRFRMLSVIGHDSSFVFRSQAPDIDAIRHKLGASFLVSGNIRRSDTRIRISARLTDADTRKAIWAEHYDRPLTDLFDVQDEVADLVAATVARQLELEITGRTGGRHPGSLSVYEQLLRGHWHFNKLTRAGNEAAFACYERAVASDPNNGEALAWLAICHVEQGLVDLNPDDIRIGVARSAEALERDPASARCHSIHSFGQVWTSGVDAALASVERALALNPGDSYVYAQRTLVAIYECQPDAAKQWLAQAMRLNPMPPIWFPEYAALIAFQEERYADALAGCEAIPETGWDVMYLLASYGHLRRHDKTKAIQDRLASEGRTYDFLAAAAREPYRDPGPRERLIEGLQLALSIPGM